MEVLVTGGSGFIGSHLAEHVLAETEHDLHLVDDFSTGDRGNVAGLTDEARVTVDELDVRNAAAVREAVADADVVYHLAAAVGVELVVDEPLRSLRTNVQGTENVLDAAAEDGTPVFVASSSEVYGKSTAVPFGEDDDRVLGPTTVPRWGYANAKAMDEFYALAHHAENDLPVVVGRFFNTVGPRQIGDYGMVVPTFVEQALAGDPITVYGDGTQTRSFTHVADTVRVVHDLMTTPDAMGKVVNVGSANPVSINELAERVLDVTDSDSRIEHVPFETAFGDDFEEPRDREPDVSRLRETIGWAPDGDLDRILADVVAERPEETEVSA
ncbi:NAD-dependent epimerase/dehydratase family protein [Halorubellus sp. JP-L1]|uniref:NAD-dependent epimerase/dehydratase family protein n=1 Tax=Halorubellus sp. JP-L1 TaxID=2715753 RepID=UPI00140E03D9|nr:NAD-dependent epimerase/dehydratase family protein [Halorubellus sp. JP-L1]NHN40921.1 NAD-dependent epimerase/dehydratase family protein [Halorubellus sp. JP-L1]